MIIYRIFPSPPSFFLVKGMLPPIVALLVVSLVFTPLPVAQGDSLADAAREPLDHHNHEMLKNTLEFVVTTLGHSLKDHGGEAFKAVNANSDVQDELKTLAITVKDQLIDIEASMQDVSSGAHGTGHVVRRRRQLSTDAVSLNLTAVEANEYQGLHANARRIKHSIEFAAVTMEHSLDLFDRDSLKKLQLDAPLIHGKLQTLAVSVETHLRDIANRFTYLSSCDSTELGSRNSTEIIRNAKDAAELVLVVIFVVFVMFLLSLGFMLLMLMGALRMFFYMILTKA